MNMESLLNLGLEGFGGEFVQSDDKYIEEVEALVGFRFPNDYKDFLRKYGVSFFTKYVEFCSLEPSSWAENGFDSMEFFYGESEDADVDIKEVQIRLNGDIPTGTIAIGHDAGANQILLNDRGEIYFFDRDTAKSTLCARDFGSFIESFRNMSSEEMFGPDEDNPEDKSE